MLSILIVDDEPFIRKGIIQLVDWTQAGIQEVYEASNGLEALAIVKEKKPHMILADINMPRMNGLDFVEAAKKMTPDVHIAMITGYDVFDYALKALKAGVDDYVLKPVTKKDIQGIIGQLVALCKADLKKTALKASIDHVLEDIPESLAASPTSDLVHYINTHLYRADFSLQGLADHLGYSSGHMSQLFKEEYGETFQHYVLTARLERAKILLLTTEMKNYEIAESVGFDDVNYFGTRFKKAYGLSPKQFKSENGA